LFQLSVSNTAESREECEVFYSGIQLVLRGSNSGLSFERLIIIHRLYCFVAYLSLLQNPRTKSLINENSNVVFDKSVVKDAICIVDLFIGGKFTKSFKKSKIQPIEERPRPCTAKVVWKLDNPIIECHEVQLDLNKPWKRTGIGVMWNNMPSSPFDALITLRIYNEKNKKWEDGCLWIDTKYSEPTENTRSHLFPSESKVLIKKLKDVEENFKSKKHLLWIATNRSLSNESTILDTNEHSSICITSIDRKSNKGKNTEESSVSSTKQEEEQQEEELTNTSGKWSFGYGLTDFFSKVQFSSSKRRTNEKK